MMARQDFRDGMARFGAAVAIVATDGPAGRAGLTASSVTSVTDEPPTLLVCINRQGHTNPVLRDNGAFTVNVLAADQRDLAMLFARSSISTAERFAAGHWDDLGTGAPALKDALVTFDCRLHQTVEVDTHTIVIGRVLALRHGVLRPALAYAGRRYHVLDIAPAPAKLAV